MKKLIFILLILSGGSFSSLAQYDTGDSELNKSLLSIDAEAKLDFSAFKADLSVSYEVPLPKIDYLSAEIGMKAGDIYMCLEIGKLADKSVDQVVNVYKANKNKGWGVIAKELGIKPGSPEFHALKGNASKPKGKGKGKGKSKGKGL